MFHEVVSELHARGYKRLASKLIAARLSYDDAVDFLSLPSKWDSDDLKRAYRNKSHEHHPDRGGDVGQMQLVNEAYKLLQKAGPRKRSDDWLEDIKKREAELARILPEMVDKIFDPHMFQKYFEKLVDKKFIIHLNDNENRRHWKREVEWRSDDGETVFTLDLIVSYNSVYRKKSLGGGDKDDLAFAVYTNRTVFHDNRKSKLKRQDFEVATTKMALTPSQMFPKTSLKRVIKGKDKERKFSKRDMLLGIQRKLNGKVDDKGGEVWARIPFGDFTLLVFRLTVLRTAGWDINGVYLKHRRVATPKKFSSAPETEDLLKGLERLQNKTWDDPNKLADAVSSLFQKARDKED